MGKTMLRLQITNTNTCFYFDVADIDFQQGLIIGRNHPDVERPPDINLQPYAGYVKGVSRHHAAIFRHDMMLMVVDLGSPNGTWLNNIRLFPHQPRVLQAGDSLRAGRLQLSVAIEALVGSR